MPLHCNSGGGVMLRNSWRAGGNGGGSGCNTMPPKPLEGDFLFAPLFFGPPTLQGDALFGALFLLEQKEVPPPP
jgi:hypothetical protein